MSFEITGLLVEKYPIVDVSGKFRKREFVISTSENSNGFEFVDYIKFQLTQDRTNLIEKYSTGDQLKVSFNLRGRKWEKDGNLTYFTNLEAWKIDKVSSVNENLQGNALPQNEVPLPGEDDFLTNSEDNGDLPF